MAWEENSRICLHMQLIAILSRTGVKVYSYEPVPDDWSEQEKRHVIGVQANVWCEYMPEERIRQYQVLPRLAALSEVQWTAASRKSYSDFLERLPRLLQLYDAAGYHYAPHCRKVNVDSYVDTVRRCAVFKFSTLGNDSIFYTLDGTSPAEHGAYYSADSLQIYETAQPRAVVKRNGHFEEDELISHRPLRTLISTDTSVHIDRCERA